MKFSCTAGRVNDALKLVMPAIGKEGVISHVHLSLTVDVLVLTCNNLGMQLQAECEVHDSFDGEITLPARKLSGLLSNLKAHDVFLFELIDQNAIAKSGRSRFKFATLPAADFPFLVADKDSAETVVCEKELREAIRECRHAIAVNDYRPYCNGMYFHSTDTQFGVVATDGSRLSEKRFNAIGNPVTAVLPKSSVTALEKLLGESDISLSAGSGTLVANNESVTLTTKLIAGKYPDWERVIPKLNAKLEIDSSQLASAINRVATFTKDKFYGVHFNFGKNRLALEARNPEREEATDESEIKYEGEEVKIDLNYRYVTDILSTISGEFSLNLQQGAGAILVNSPSGARHVVLKMRM